jgi:hypothetical protein
MLRAFEPKCLTMSPSACAVVVSLQAEELRKVALGAAGTHKPGEPFWYSDIGHQVEQLLESAIGKQAMLRDYQSPKPKTVSTAILPPLHGSLFCDLSNIGLTDVPSPAVNPVLPVAAPRLGKKTPGEKSSAAATAAPAAHSQLVLCQWPNSRLSDLKSSHPKYLEKGFIAFERAWSPLLYSFAFWIWHTSPTH